MNVSLFIRLSSLTGHFQILLSWGPELTWPWFWLWPESQFCWLSLNDNQQTGRILQKVNKSWKRFPGRYILSSFLSSNSFQIWQKTIYLLSAASWSTCASPALVSSGLMAWAAPATGSKRIMRFTKNKESFDNVQNKGQNSPQ